MDNVELTKVAIATLEEYKQDDDNGNYDIFDLAIQALEEKQERENPQPLTLEKLKAIKRPIPLYKRLLTDDIGEYIGVNNEWWDVCCGTTEASGIVYWRSGHTNNVSDYGKTWLAYDHEPKEATND